jgi:hypothetical protein
VEPTVDVIDWAAGNRLCAAKGEACVSSNNARFRQVWPSRSPEATTAQATIAPALEVLRSKGANHFLRSLVRVRHRRLCTVEDGW